MQWEIGFSQDHPLMTIRAWGPAALQGFVDYLTQALADPRWKPQIQVLLDFRELDLATVSSDDMRRLVSFQRPLKESLSPGKLALVVGRPVDFGMARMWEVLSSEIGLTQGVFYSLEEAFDWLKRHQA
jgi:hypothetical protein